MSNATVAGRSLVECLNEGSEYLANTSRAIVDAARDENPANDWILMSELETFSVE